MRYVRIVWSALLYLAAVYGLGRLAGDLADMSLLLPEPTVCRGEIYELEVNTVPDVYALSKLTTLMSGTTHVYRLRLDVWEKDEYAPVLYVWTEADGAPNCGFRINNLEVRRVRGGTSEDERKRALPVDRLAYR